MADYEKRVGASERLSELVGAVTVTAYATAVGVALAPTIPIVGVTTGSAMALACAVTFARNRWALGSALVEHQLVRSLRKRRAVIGLAVPLGLVQSQDGACCAYEHVVHRCEPCACIRPCTAFGGRFRAVDRGSGRFLVRGPEEAVLIEGGEVRFDTNLWARSSSHFERLEPGERLRIRGELEATAEIPDDVRALLASHREQPRVLVPRAGTAVLVEKLG